MCITVIVDIIVTLIHNTLTYRHKGASAAGWDTGLSLVGIEKSTIVNPPALEA